MAYSREKQQKLTESLINIGSLVGTNFVGIANGIEGLGIGVEQNRCTEEAEAVRDGLFKVSIMGTFSSGKSTVINALVGAKILPESPLPCTAILTHIKYGDIEKENCAYVYMADKLQNDGSVIQGECRCMSVDEFQNEYKYTIEDEKEFQQNGTVKRFAEVKYAVMYCSKPLMEGGVSIIDSPGLEDKKVATDLALRIADEVQAIIYVVTEKGFGDSDRGHIKKFHNCPNNVFFLLNKFDLIRKEDRPDTIDKLKLELKHVFTDENGLFNEELCNRRMFGISALRALDARRGITYDSNVEEDIPLSIDECKRKYELSYFEPFEKELEMFLTTDEKCKAQYQKCFSQMASTYRNANVQINDYLRVYENEIRMDEEQKAECVRLIENICTSINLTKTTFDNCSLRIQNKIDEVLRSCAATIDRSWDQDMVTLADKVDVGILSYMWTGLKQINPLASQQTKQDDMKKFTEKFITVVTDYFVEKVNAYIDDNKLVILNEVEECQKLLNVKLDDTENLFKDFAEKLTRGREIHIVGSDKNWLQIMISGYLGDYSAALRGATEGKVSWVDYLKKTIFNTVWQMVLLSLVDGGLGVLLALGIEFMQGRSNRNDTVRKILSKSKDGVVRAIREQTNEFCAKLNNQIAVEINKQKMKTIKDMEQKLLDEQKKMETINAAYANHNFSLTAERTRFDTILSTIYEEAQSAYAVVFGEELTLQRFKTF